MISHSCASQSLASPYRPAEPTVGFRGPRAGAAKARCGSGYAGGTANLQPKTRFSADILRFINSIHTVHSRAAGAPPPSTEYVHAVESPLRMVSTARRRSLMRPRLPPCFTCRPSTWIWSDSIVHANLTARATAPHTRRPRPFLSFSFPVSAAAVPFKMRPTRNAHRCGRRKHTHTRTHPLIPLLS